MWNTKNFDKRGCIYAAWVISGLEIVMCPVIWYCRGFRHERKVQKSNKISNNHDQDYEKYLPELDSLLQKNNLAAYQ